MSDTSRKTKDLVALDAAARAALLAHDVASNLELQLRVKGDAESEDQARQCKELCERAVGHTIRAGAASPLEGEIPRDERLDLRELAALDSPEARILLSAVIDLIPIAEAVDAQRGRTVGEDTQLQPGESRGTDLAETFTLLALRLRRETMGPRGMD